MHDDGWPRHRRLVRAKSLAFGIRRRPKSRSHSSGQTYQTRVDLRLPPGARVQTYAGRRSFIFPSRNSARSSRRMIAVTGARSRISRHACCHACRSRRAIFATPFIFLTLSDTIWGPCRVAAIFSQSPGIRLVESYLEGERGRHANVFPRERGRMSWLKTMVKTAASTIAAARV